MHAQNLKKQNSKMSIKVKVEKDTDGLFWGYSSNIPGVVSATGETLSDLKKNFEEALKQTFDVADELEMVAYKKYADKIDLEYELEITELFEKLEFLNKSAVAKRLHINPSLFRNYTSKKEVYISEKRAKEIEKGIHDLGKELIAIKL